MIFDYLGKKYPEYIKHGNACKFIQPIAEQFCKGTGLDVGAGKWPLGNATPVDLDRGGDAMGLPRGSYDYIFSSHCLEHLQNPVAALEHWKSRLRAGGTLFLYLPHPDMEYWLPQRNRKHLHIWYPEQIAKLLDDMGFVNVLVSERDLAWSFAAVGFKREFIPVEQKDKPFQELVEEKDPVIKNDPQLSSIYDRFGRDAFRRTAGLEDFEKFIIANDFKGDCCLEIGTYNGITAFILARHFKQVISIDIFPHTAKHAIKDFIGVKNVRFIDVKDNEEKAEAIKSFQFDAAFVDGDHENDSERDFKLVSGCKRVMFHEYWEQQPAVWNLVNGLREYGRVVTQGKLALWTR